MKHIYKVFYENKGRPVRGYPEKYSLFFERYNLDVFTKAHPHGYEIVRIERTDYD